MKSEFVTEVDWIPTFWTFLVNLNPKDLIAELVQNDLDQDATCTVISFGQDQIISEGDGKPIDANGWQRLRKIQGAGHEVPAKCGKIGVKNHGLKTAFTIGDDIHVLSGGQAITQTLYANGPNSVPHPGASPEPKPDPRSPLEGCRIIIEYRTRDFSTRNGEAIHFRSVTEQDIASLFKSACTAAPEQFSGIVSPMPIPRYEITLRHWKLGEATFTFTCTRPRKAKKGVDIFRRRCAVTGNASDLPPDLLEEAARRSLPLKGQLKHHRIPDFYRIGDRYFVEVSWPIHKRGKPKTGSGRFRYPIGYPEGSQRANTGHGGYFNVPVVSDTERHGPAQNEAIYAELRRVCEKLLVDALTHHVIPRWGADGLNPLVPNPMSNNQDDAVRPLLATLASHSALPIVKWHDVVNNTLKRRNKANSGEHNLLIRWRPKEPRKYNFVIPVMTWNCQIADPSLSLICPRSEKQIDPRVHPGIIGFLVDGKTDGFCEYFAKFDQNHAMNRAIGKENRWFAKCRNSEQEFSHPMIAHAYLDVINESIKHGKCDEEIQYALRKKLLLPNNDCKPYQFESLYTGAKLPSDVPSLKLPPILHRNLITHPLFRRKLWRRESYRMSTFLGSGKLQNADDKTRNLFWEWLRHNEDSIGNRERIKLADMPIWSDTAHNLRTLPSLCDPRSRRIVCWRTNRLKNIKTVA